MQCNQMSSQTPTRQQLWIRQQISEAVVAASLDVQSVLAEIASEHAADRFAQHSGRSTRSGDRPDFRGQSGDGKRGGDTCERPAVQGLNGHRGGCDRRGFRRALYVALRYRHSLTERARCLMVGDWRMVFECTVPHFSTPFLHFSPFPHFPFSFICFVPHLPRTGPRAHSGKI